MTRVLIVDDDPVQLRLTAEVANRAGFRPLTATGGEQALTILRGDSSIGAVILDLIMPDLDGMAVMETMARERILTPVIVQTANASLETVVTAMRHGAADYFVKPVSPERLVISLRNALKLEALEAVVRAEHSKRNGTFTRADLVGTAPALARVLSLCNKASKSNLPVLVEGEAGVGKELVARIIHGTGDRVGRPFVTFNCASATPAQLDAKLFGCKKGWAPGAHADQTGLLAEAHGGTLYLDEIGELSPDIQEKLLRVLTDGEIMPAGASRPERVNVRLILATSRRLLNLAKSGEFREDLYYRLNVLPIYVPPLRERLEDIPTLVNHFIARFAAEAGKRVLGISLKAMDLLAGYSWPGNVRQLENMVYRAIVLCEDAFLEPADFPQILAQTDGRDHAVAVLETTHIQAQPIHIDDAGFRPRVIETPSAPDRFLDAGGEVAALAQIERAAIVFAISHYGGRMSRVARALGIGRSTLYRKLHEYGLAESFISDAA